MTPGNRYPGGRGRCRSRRLSSILYSRFEVRGPTSSSSRPCASSPADRARVRACLEENARRISSVWSASAGYSFGRGQKLSPEGITNPAELFDSGFFQTAAVQLDAGLSTGTNVRTVFRFSPEATVFAIDPFAGRLAVYDPSLSIQVTQDLPTFGLPVRAEAIIDARNLLDFQAQTDNGEIVTQVGSTRRSVRGGISLRF